MEVGSFSRNLTASVYILKYSVSVPPRQKQAAYVIFQTAKHRQNPGPLTLCVIDVTLFTHIMLLCTGYSADGSRLVAGVVAVSSDKKKVLVVESTNRRNHWVLPKGGYETDEPSAEEAAARKNTLSLLYYLPLPSPKKYPQRSPALFYSQKPPS